MFGPFWSVWCKIALAEVGVSLLWDMLTFSAYYKGAAAAGAKVFKINNPLNEILL